MMIEKLQNVLENSDFDSALIVSPENRFYFTGFNSSDGFLIVGKNDAVFITDGRYIEAAQNKIKNCRVLLQERSRTQLCDILKKMGAQKTAVEADRMTLSEYAETVSALDGTEVVADGALDRQIDLLRSVKTRTEAEKIRTAQKIAEDAFSHICGFIKEGISEKEISLELDYYMLSHGAEALSFETIAVSGKKGSMPHGVPDGNTVKKGDLITMDFGAVYEGYHSDMTRTVAVGFVSDEQRLVYDTVLKAQNEALSVIKSGISCKAADEAARNIIDCAGFGEYFNHSTGHGVGVEIHEYPNLSPVSDKLLQTGNIVTVEPGIYIPEKFGVRIEDMVFVTDNGCENLTSAPKELIIL